MGTTILRWPSDDGGHSAEVGFSGLGSRRQAAWAQAIETMLVAKVIGVKRVRRVGMDCAATNGTQMRGGDLTDRELSEQ
jgi:hypothetical protein